MSRKMFPAFLVVSLAYFAPFLAGAQLLGCGIPSTDTEVASLIAGNYGTAQSSALPTIVLQTASTPMGFRYRIVCLSSSGFRDQYRFVSIVAYYTKDGGGPEYGQYEFECVQSHWTSSSILLEQNVFNRRILTSTSPALNASLRTDCSYCLSPFFLSTRASDPINHCNREPRFFFFPPSWQHPLST